jgi:hypothetical protein
MYDTDSLMQFKVILQEVLHEQTKHESKTKHLTGILVRSDQCGLENNYMMKKQ